MTEATSNESIIESPPRPEPSVRRRLALAAVAVLAAGAVTGGVLWHNRGSGQGAPAAGPATAAPRASELYAADGTTLIARFDTDDPRDACLRAPVNDWGFYCDSLVAWWRAQAAFGDGADRRLNGLRHGGYRITGSLDVQLQADAKRRVDQTLPTADRNVFTLATIEPGTGLVRAMAASRNFRRPAAVSPSPPADPDHPPVGAVGPDSVDALVAGDEAAPGDEAGAPFMLFTLAAALESGLTLDHPIDTQRVYQSKYVIDPQSPAACRGRHFYCPANTGDAAYLQGRRTMWDAFGHAVVTYFVPLQEQIGAGQAVGLAQRLGITFHGSGDAMLSKSPAQWGAFTLGVSATSALDLANAYATLAADGTHCDPLPAAKVTDAEGRPVDGVGPHCTSVLRPELARAAIDAARCPVGDRSAFGDRCGAGSGPATAVRQSVGRPVAGQAGQSTSHSACSTVVAGPQLVTAGMIGAAPGNQWSAPRLAAGLPDAVTAAVAGVQHTGLAPLPVRDFTAPPPEIAIAS